jgi:hypothetical protein
LSWGASMGWFSPALEILKGSNSPLYSGPLNEQGFKLSIIQISKKFSTISNFIKNYQ